MYFLGVDGGGTKTTFSLIDSKGCLLTKHQEGTCHYIQVGFEGLRNILITGINTVCDLIGINKQDITYAFFGLPGFGEVKEDAQKMVDIMKEVLQNKNYTIDNDVIAGWAGSLGCEPGINIVAGTGSICIGIDRYKNRYRSSGWGHFYGDEGSAYWIGKKTIEAFCKQSDNRLPKGSLYTIIRNELNLKDDFDIITLIHKEYAFDRSRVATFFKMAYKAANQGDISVQNFFREAAYEYAIMVDAVLNNIELEDRVIVSYSGGVFNAGDIILKPLEEILISLSPKIVLKKPILNPSLGSALYALVEYNNINKVQYEYQNIIKQLVKHND